ncbi:hypothetical protein HanXRQr2_Chr16g0765861 [Helianthus annuus]|uniref:Uncharacterized protein n=1 Tax=Helianthus annuus TaxID=4232 RepID=A0A9K3DTV3_HELAN|nr:hypothetical protein HanXRQr2_Chr16g0765861 [Helianthus annuus]KAJ0822605.1 hypothetical protein HanPSC8_Chr16g0734021 [Helianthus annuus]
MANKKTTGSLRSMVRRLGLPECIQDAEVSRWYTSVRPDDSGEGDLLQCGGEDSGD